MDPMDFMTKSKQDNTKRDFHAYDEDSMLEFLNAIDYKNFKILQF